MKDRPPYESARLLRGDALLSASAPDNPMLVHSDTAPDGGAYEIDVAGPAGSAAHVSWIHTGIPIAPPPDQDNAMKVRRWYFDEHGRPLSGMTLRSGQLIRVEVSVEAAPGTRNIVIEDLLPAGLEVENPRL